ncbi:MAG TPA: tetratricopeptide repeat protein [Candidatus Acidoferrales bacterium]|nr:tetratricopeptide repeat protein [Candidatus Acidoferrales bacterium]
MAHISRKELKKDEVRETLVHGAQALLSHQQLSTYVIIAAVIIAAGIFGWRTYSERQTVKASAAFDDAMKIFEARVRTAGEAAAPGEVTYVDDKMKFTDAAAKFTGVAKQYARTRFGVLSNYYLALSDEKLSKDADAKKLLQSVSESSDPEYAAMAKFELAQMDDRSGADADAVKLYQQLMEKPTDLVPKAVVMLALAEHYRQKNPDEAAKLYTQIKSEFPDTPIADQADQELALLPGKS